MDATLNQKEIELLRGALAKAEKQLEEEREQRLAAEREKAELLASEEAHRSVSLASAVPNSAPPPSPAAGGEPGEVLDLAAEPATDEDAAAAPAPEPTRSTVEFLAAELAAASVGARSSL